MAATSPNKRRKTVLFIFLVLGLLLVDIVVSNTKAGVFTDTPVDAIIYESGSNDVDGYTGASIKTHVALVTSGMPGLSFSKGPADTLTNAEIREMVFKTLSLDTYYGTAVPALKYVINNVPGAVKWVALKSNLSYVPGRKYTAGDQEDPRVVWALIDYIADSTDATRISFLAGGTYSGSENDIFELSDFNGIRWNQYFPGLPDDFTLKSIIDSAKARNPSKTIETININYNEILTGGRPYNELTPAERVGKTPVYMPVPSNGSPVGALTTAEIISDSAYSPSDAILNCDVFVNVPVIKTGGIPFNCAMKNYIGSISRGVYGSGTGYPRDRTTSQNIDHDLLYNTVVNLFSYHPADYTFIDGLASLEGDGSHPWGEATGFYRRNLLIAGEDPVATEAVAAASVNLNPADLDNLRWARAKGYGNYELAKILVIGAQLDSVRRDVMACLDLPTRTGYTNFTDYHYFGRGCRRWLINGPYSAATIKTPCLDEALADPRPDDIINNKAWAPYYSPGNYVDILDAMPGIGSDSMVYAFTQIYSDRAQSGRLYIGGVRDIRVLVNGAAVVDSATSDQYNRVGIITDVSLNPGDNRILVKVRGTTSAFGFSLAVVNDGSLSARSSYVPYINNNVTALGAPRTLNDEKKRSYFGGRTLSGTFYHLGQSEIAVEKAALPGSALYLACAPNPSSGPVRLSFSAPRGESPVTLTVYTISGQLVSRVYYSSGSRGPGQVSWNGRDYAGNKVPNGVYLCRFSAGGASRTLRLVRIR